MVDKCLKSMKRGLKNETLHVSVVYSLQAQIEENESILKQNPILHKTRIHIENDRNSESLLTEFKNSRACDTTISVLGHFTK